MGGTILSQPCLHESTLRYIKDAKVARDYDRHFGDQELFGYDCAVLDSWFERLGRLLDLGCGTGRHLVHFGRRGFAVTGVDLSAYMLAEAEAKLARHGVSGQLIQGDFCQLKLAPPSEGEALPENSFDYALCMFSTIGLIYGAKNRLDFLQTVRRLLKSGGQLAVHVHSKGYNIWRHEGRFFLLSNFIRSRWGSAEPGDKFLSFYRGVKGMYIHVFTEGEITGLLEEAGFAVREVLALNRKRNDRLRGDFLRGIRANGFLVHARVEK